MDAGRGFGESIEVGERGGCNLRAAKRFAVIEVS